MKKLLRTSLMFLVNIAAFGQENPILGHWEIQFEDNEVVLDWTIISGNTCQGIYIWRSANGIDFQEIGHIPGLCGSVSEPIDYTWVDMEPLELSTNYYRVELGGQGLSSVKSVYIDKLVQTGSLVYPNPATQEATLIFQSSENENKEILIFNSAGSLVYQEKTVGKDRILINAGILAPGTYIYNIRSASGSNSGRFIVL